VAEEAPRGLATKQDLRLALAQLQARLSNRVGVMLAAAATILLAGIAVIPLIMPWIVRA
jgi:hypothetical protein